MKRSDITDEQVVQACIDFHDSHGPVSGVRLIEQTGAPRSVVTAAMERASRRNLIDYGVSLWSAWPTDKGRALVDDGDEEDKAS